VNQPALSSSELFVRVSLDRDRLFRRMAIGRFAAWRSPVSGITIARFGHRDHPFRRMAIGRFGDHDRCGGR
jgi:hypothetical protein